MISAWETIWRSVMNLKSLTLAVIRTFFFNSAVAAMRASRKSKPWERWYWFIKSMALLVMLGWRLIKGREWQALLIRMSSSLFLAPDMSSARVMTEMLGWWVERKSLALGLPRNCSTRIVVSARYLVTLPQTNFGSLSLYPRGGIINVFAFGPNTKNVIQGIGL